MSASTPTAHAQKERLDPKFITLAVILLVGMVVIGST